MVRPCWGAGLGGGGRNLLSQEPDPALGDPVPDSLHTKKNTFSNAVPLVISHKCNYGTQSLHAVAKPDRAYVKNSLS